MKSLVNQDSDCSIKVNSILSAHKEVIKVRLNYKFLLLL